MKILNPCIVIKMNIVSLNHFQLRLYKIEVTLIDPILIQYKGLQLLLTNYT